MKEAACDAVQKSSYRKSTRQFTVAAGEDKLFSITTVWNIKQEKGRQLEKEQEQWLDNPDALPLVSVPNISPMRIEMLLRYLWNKREIIVNDEERKGIG